MANHLSSLDFPDLEIDERTTRTHQEIRMQHGVVPDLGRRRSKRANKSLPRARWNHQMKAYLIELLKDYNVPGYRTQNAWSNEAWNSITNRINQKFGLSLAVAQVKQKEQDLKKDFRSVKDLAGESGFGWDPNRMMVVAPDEVWETFGERINKDSLRWRDKSFPYFDDLFVLYEGRYAEGKNRHGMDHYASKAKQQSHGAPSAYSPSESVCELHSSFIKACVYVEVTNTSQRLV